MEKDNPANDQAETGADRSPRSSANKRNKENNKSSGKEKKSRKGRKKPFCEVWRSYSRVKQAQFIGAGLVGAATVVYAIAFIIVSIKQYYQAQSAHMPLVINYTPPDFLQPFICIGPQFHSGNIHATFKNVGTATALRVIPFVNKMRIIREKQFGKDAVNTVPIGDCKIHPKMGDIEYQIPAGGTLSPEIRQMVGALSPPFEKDEPVQLYWVSCVYYSDKYGGDHGTCDTYRMLFPSSNPLDVLSGSPTFFCDGTSKTGKFQGAITGHCEE